MGCGQAPKQNTANAQPSAPGMNTNSVDANGRKQGPWVVTGATEHVPGYSEADKIREGNYKDGKKQGVWIEYYPGGSVKDKIEYRNDTLVKVVEMDSVKR